MGRENPVHLGYPIATGNTAEIYLVENKIVKVFHDALPNTESMKEATKQEYAYSCGLPVPKILEVTKINGKQAIMMEYIKGETLGDLFFRDKERLEFYLNLSIDMQRKIHSVIPDSIELMQDKLTRQIESLTCINPRQKASLLNKLTSMSYEKRLCHGDFHLFNLIKCDNHVVILDWVDASSGDIRGDIYRTYLLYYQFSTELAKTYVRLYCERSGVLESDVMQWAPIIAAARLSEQVSSDNAEQLMEIVNSSLE